MESDSDAMDLVAVVAAALRTLLCELIFLNSLHFQNSSQIYSSISFFLSHQKIYLFVFSLYGCYTLNNFKRFKYNFIFSKLLF